MLAKLAKAVFYDAGRHARRLSFIQVGAGTILRRPARFDFRLGSRSFEGSIAIDSDCMIAAEFIFESNRGKVEIGSRSFINSGTRLICRESILIGSDVTIAWDCTIYDHNSHSLDWRERAADIARQLADVRESRSLVHSKDWASVVARPIIIEDKAWLGFGVTVLNGVRIGEGAIVGARSVVRQDVPPWTVVCGNPAVPVRALEHP